MSPVVLAVAGLFAVGFGAVAIFAGRRRYLGKLAVREATRRKGQALLVVAGLMVGTAAITAALVAADSVDATSADLAVRGWGSVDLTVTAGGGFFPADVAAPPAVRRADDGRRRARDRPDGSRFRPRHPAGGADHLGGVRSACPGTVRRVRADHRAADRRARPRT